SRNLYAWDMATGETSQLTNLKEVISASKKKEKKDTTQQEKWLANDRQLYFDVLRLRKEKSTKSDAYRKSIVKDTIRSISIEDDKEIHNLNISPDGRFITYTLEKEPEEIKNT